MKNFKEAQADMRQSYFGGAPGVMVSGIVWLLAGMVALFSTQQNSVLSLFFGGMLIHPMGTAITKILKRSGKHQPENPLAWLALESTVILLFGFFIAFTVYQVRPNWFFPLFLLIIGGRYLLFSSLYGMRTYWLLGMSLALSGIGSIYLDLPFYQGAFLGGIIEIIFASLLFYVAYSHKALIEHKLVEP